MRKMVFGLALIAMMTTAANAQLTLFYDVRPTIADIDSPVPPYTNTVSLPIQYGYGVGQVYPLDNGGDRGDGAIIYLCPKMADVTDYTGQGPPDGIDEHFSTFGPDWSEGDFYLYASFVGAGKVVSSIGVNQAIPASAFTVANDTYFLGSVTTTVVNPTLWSGTNITAAMPARL